MYVAVKGGEKAIERFEDFSLFLQRVGDEMESASGNVIGEDSFRAAETLVNLERILLKLVEHVWPEDERFCGESRSDLKKERLGGRRPR